MNLPLSVLGPTALLVLLTGCATHPAAPATPAPSGVTCLRPPTSATGTARLDELRMQIDCADRELARLVGERLEIARRIGAVKQAMGAPVVDTVREAAVTTRFVQRAAAEGVPEATAATLIRTLITAARAEQE